METQVSQVQCYSGHSYAQRPTSFTWMETKYQISAVIKEEHTPQGKKFLVKTPEGELFSLDYHNEPVQWTVSPAGQPKNPEEDHYSYD